MGLEISVKCGPPKLGRIVDMDCEAIISYWSYSKFFHRHLTGFNRSHKKVGIEWMNLDDWYIHHLYSQEYRDMWE